ncbi:hypothetical protein ACWEQC_05880 [Streptomyces shenzhenensis]
MPQVAFDHKALNILALEPGEHGFEPLPDRVGDRICERGQQYAIHGEDSLARVVRPSVSGHGVVEATVTAQRQDGRPEQVASHLLAVAVEEAVGPPENEVEFAGVVVGKGERDHGASGLRGNRLVNRPARQELEGAKGPAVRPEEPVQLLDASG